jgi:hypothetical protein
MAGEVVKGLFTFWDSSFFAGMEVMMGFRLRCPQLGQKSLSQRTEVLVGELVTYCHGFGCVQPKQRNTRFHSEVLQDDHYQEERKG